MEADSLGESRIAPGGQEHLAHESQFWMYSAAQEFTSDLEEISGIPTNRPIKTLCLLFILGSLIISVTGRGVIFILQGILNIIFAVEGYQGAANLDQPSVLRVSNSFPFPPPHPQFLASPEHSRLVFLVPDREHHSEHWDWHCEHDFH